MKSGEAAQAVSDIGMRDAKCGFINVEGPFRIATRLQATIFGQTHLGQVVEIVGDVGVVGTQRLFLQFQRLPEKRLGIGEATLLCIKHAEIYPGANGVWVVIAVCIRPQPVGAAKKRLGA